MSYAEGTVAHPVFSGCGFSLLFDSEQSAGNSFGLYGGVRRGNGKREFQDAQ